MSVAWTNLILWPLVALIGVPILVHLFARSNPPKYPFSSLNFLRRVIRKTNRVRRPRDWLLLFLRTLLFTLIICLFLLPLLVLSSGYDPFKSRNVVVIVDRSASMNWVEGAQSRFTAACAEAAGILEDLSAGDKANIVWLDKSPETVFPEMGTNISHLIDRLRQKDVSSEKGDAAGALRLASRMIEDAQGRKEICIVSDFQKTQWAQVSLQVPEDASLALVKTAREKASNVAVNELTCKPAAPLKGETVRVYARIHNFSDQPQKRRVSLRSKGTRKSRKTMIPARDERTVIFRQRMTSSGEVPIEVSLNHDTFTLDDKRGRVLDVKEKLSIAIAGISRWGNKDKWYRALDAIDWSEPFQFNTDSLSDVNADVVMIDGWDGSNAERMKTLVANGTSALLAPGRNFKPTAIRKLFDLPSDSNLKQTFATEGRPFKVKISAPDHDVFSLFSEGDHGDPARAYFSSRAPLTMPIGTKKLNVLMQYEDGITALATRTDNATACLWNLPLKDKYSDWANTPVFLPFLGELILAIRPLPERAFRHVEPGDTLVHTLSSGTSKADTTLKSETDEKVAFNTEPYRNSLKATTDPLPGPGLYKWIERERVKECQYANVNSLESNLKTMAGKKLNSPTAASFSTAAQVNQLSRGIELWPWLLAAALLIALIETVITNLIKDK